MIPTPDLPVQDFCALGRWLERAEREFEEKNRKEPKTDQECIHLSLLSAVIVRVLKIRGDYLAKHNP